MLRYSYKKEYNWSSNIAYSVGLIASDGSLSKDGRHIDLTSVDVNQLENFIMAINKPLKISSKNKKIHVAYRVQFSDVAYYDFLVQAGLTPNKSKSIQRVKVPDVYWCDFLRGLFDGDGSVYGYYDKRWPTSLLYYLTITSASKEFLEFVHRKNCDLIKVKGGSIRRAKGAYILSYAKYDTRLIAKCLYTSEMSLCLLRKKSKLLTFINNDKSGRIVPNARVVKLVYT